MNPKRALAASVVLAGLASSALPQIREHVDPHMVVRAPGVGSTTEAGVGALIPWADRLWAVGYVAHIRGQGLGLYEIGPDMTWRKRPESVTGTYANRFVHWPSRQVVIGPHVIDDQGNVRTFEPLATGWPERPRT